MKNDNDDLETLLLAKCAATERAILNFANEMERETEFLKSIGFYAAAMQTERAAAQMQTFVATYRNVFYDGIIAKT